MTLINFWFLKILFSWIFIGIIFFDGLLAFFAKGANPQQDIKVAIAAIVPLSLPIVKYPNSFLERILAAIIKPLNPAKIEPVNLAAFNLVLIDTFYILII